jgi:hypothetical protein
MLLNVAALCHKMLLDVGPDLILLFLVPADKNKSTRIKSLLMRVAFYTRPLLSRKAFQKCMLAWLVTPRMMASAVSSS